MKHPAITLLMLTAITATSKSNDHDPYVWLEELEGREALEWVEARNAASLEVLTGTDSYREAFESSLEIMNSDDRIAAPSLRGDYIYNFWQDADNPRGVWRRCNKENYLAGEPDWDMPLDGSNPILLYAYGGFEVSMLPSYSALRGKSWL